MTGIAATAKGFEETVAQVLGVLQRFVDNDLAGVLLVEERAPTSPSPARLRTRTTANSSPRPSMRSAPRPVPSIAVNDMDLRVMDPDENLGGDDEGRMATFLSMPLRGHGGRVIGVLALSSATKNAFSETALGTLRLVEDPAAIVIDNARLAVAHTHDLTSAQPRR